MPWDKVAAIGPWGLVTIFFLLMFMGWLVPKATHERELRDKDEQIKDLRDQRDTMGKALDKRDAQIHELATLAEMNVQLLEELKDEAARRQRFGGRI